MINKTGSQNLTNIIPAPRPGLSGMWASAASAFIVGLRARTFRLGRILLGALAVIGGVKTGTLKDDPDATTDQPLDRLAAFRTFLKMLIGHLLKRLKSMPAMRAFVFVSRHSYLIARNPREFFDEFALLAAEARRYLHIDPD